MRPEVAQCACCVLRDPGHCGITSEEWQAGLEALVGWVEHGARPGKELLERSEGIRKQWIEYFGITTGGRASMTAIPR